MRLLRYSFQMTVSQSMFSKRSSALGKCLSKEFNHSYKDSEGETGLHNSALFTTTGLFNIFCTVMLHIAVRMLDLGIRMFLIPQEAFLPQQVISFLDCL